MPRTPAGPSLASPAWLALFASLAAVIGLLAGCSPGPAGSAATAGATDPVVAATAGVPAPGSLAPSATFAVPATGFAFDAESVAGFYLTRGYACAEPVPSELAVGYSYRSCELTDRDGRRLVIGLVTDPAGDLADGFASLRGAPGEAFVDPTIALEPLAGFLGAMLGEERGTALVPWLAGHLGDEFAETMAADLHVATYTRRGDGQTTLVVEVANDAYLETPRPSRTPGPS